MASIPMELVNVIAVVVVIGVLAVYGAVRRPARISVSTYLRGALLFSTAVLALAVLRAAGAIPATSLFDGLLFGLILLIPLGLALVIASELREERQLRLLRTGATMLMPTMDLETLLDQVLDLAHAAVRVDGSSVLLFDPETRELYFAAARAIDAEQTRDYRISIDHPAIKAVWQGHGPVIVPDVEEVPAFREILVRPGLRSFFGIPMVTRDRLVGFVNVHRLRVSTLRADEIDLLTALASQAAVAMTVSQLYADLQRRYLDTVRALASAIEINDPNTLGHSRRVAETSRLLAAEMGLEPALREAVEVAALLHDIGKIGVRASVLRKLGRLSQHERAEIREHSMLGALVLRDVQALRDIVPSVLHHHEWWDGTGYPHGLRGEDIPLIACIVAVADAYEVMTAGRPYRAARRSETVIAEIKRMAGRQFNPDVVDALVQIHQRGELPPPEGLARGAEDSEQAAAS